MARIVKREGPLFVTLRTEGAVIVPKPIRDRLGLRAGDLLEVEVRGAELVLRPRPMRRLTLKGVPAASFDKLIGLAQLGGDAVRSIEWVASFDQSFDRVSGLKRVGTAAGFTTT